MLYAREQFMEVGDLVCAQIRHYSQTLQNFTQMAVQKARTAKFLAISFCKMTAILGTCLERPFKDGGLTIP